MRVESSAVKLFYEHICRIVGQLAQHSVIWINHISPYVQHAPIAYLSLAGANIIFFEVALSVGRVTNWLFNQCQTNKEPQDSASPRRSVGLSMLFISVLAAENYGFCKALRLPLSCWKVVTVSIITSGAYLYLKSQF